MLSPDPMEARAESRPEGLLSNPGKVPRTRAGDILIIDDETDIRESLQEILELHGYSVRTASNGTEGWAEINRAEKPALVFLDLMMPGMSGWDFMKIKRENPSLDDITVVVISADSTAETKARAMEVDEYLRKPIHLDVLLQTVRAHCVPAA